ncbi:hypothetical protein P12x_000604 [Tundrisphaera lichenicola]|uniref:hypothetical protein n=1 Tax=Tundrisphaera lichenicola TaxID=2029860 RepID=UPI003EB96E54
MSKKLTWATAALLALAGCGDQAVTDPADSMATPSEAAKTVNENPSSPTIDVPNTPQNEAEVAKEKEAPEAPAATPTEPATIEPKAEEASKPE